MNGNKIVVKEYCAGGSRDLQRKPINEYAPHFYGVEIIVGETATTIYELFRIIESIEQDPQRRWKMLEHALEPLG